MQATLFEKGGFQGHGAGPATKCSTRNMAILREMGHGPIGDGAFGTWGSGGPDDPCGRAGRRLPRPVRPAGGGRWHTARDASRRSGRIRPAPAPVRWPAVSVHTPGLMTPQRQVGGSHTPPFRARDMAESGLMIGRCTGIWTWVALVAGKGFLAGMGEFRPCQPHFCKPWDSRAGSGRGVHRPY